MTAKKLMTAQFFNPPPINQYNGIDQGGYKRLTPLVKTLPREHSSYVVECLTRDQGVTGFSLSSVTVLCP